MRMLAQKWRWTGGDAQGEGQSPGYVKSYLEAVAPKHGFTPEDLEQEVERILGECLKQWLVDPDSLTVVSPRPDASGNIDAYRWHAVRVFAPASVGWLLHDVQSAAGPLAGRTLGQERTGRLLRIPRTMR